MSHTTLPEFARVLRPGGVLQLTFKCGCGVLTLPDPDYGEERTFRLHDEHTVLARLGELDLALIPPASEGELGGVMHFTNNNGIEHCLTWSRKR